MAFSYTRIFVYLFSIVLFENREYFGSKIKLKITNSNFLVYYDFNGDPKRKIFKRKFILEIRQYIEYWENHK